MLFCLTAEYTPQALNAMRENPNTNRRAAVEQVLKAAGGDARLHVRQGHQWSRRSGDLRRA